MDPPPPEGRPPDGRANLPPDNRRPPVRPVFLVYKAESSPACQAFLDYLLSAEAQELLHANGLIKAK